ncbi:MAG: hypothetical protein WAL13_08030 [Trebonia sp.]
MQRNRISDQPRPDVRGDEQRGQLPAQPRDRAGSPGAPRMPMRPALIGSCSTPAEAVTWPGNIARSQAGQGVGRGSSCGVTIAVLARA